MSRCCFSRACSSRLWFIHLPDLSGPCSSVPRMCGGRNLLSPKTIWLVLKTSINPSILAATFQRGSPRMTRSLYLCYIRRALISVSRRAWRHIREEQLTGPDAAVPSVTLIGGGKKKEFQRRPRRDVGTTNTNVYSAPHPEIEEWLTCLVGERVTRVWEHTFLHDVCVVCKWSCVQHVGGMVVHFGYNAFSVLGDQFEYIWLPQDWTN